MKVTLFKILLNTIGTKPTKEVFPATGHRQPAYIKHSVSKTVKDKEDECHVTCQALESKLE